MIAYCIIRGRVPNQCGLGTFRPDVADRWRAEGYTVEEVDPGPDGENWIEETITDVQEADALGDKGCGIPRIP